MCSLRQNVTTLVRVVFLWLPLTCQREPECRRNLEGVSVLDPLVLGAIRRYSRSDRVVRGGPSEVKPIRSGWASCLDVTAIDIFRALVVSSTLPLNLAFSERFLSINYKVRSSVKALTFPMLYKSISIDLNMKQISTLLRHRFPNHVYFLL